ncbi:golgin-45 [Diaphorina citri]|uniref:Golgin-45 n=1 Tax=Diaphorina citri TaxID=121845 RepID=A0A3Q0J1F6_DIACI|nr:golgin-45 [Diaphorina citri]
MDKLNTEMKEKIMKSNQELMKKLNESNADIINKIQDIKKEYNIENIPDKNNNSGDMFNPRDNSSSMNMFAGDSVVSPKIVALNLSETSMSIFQVEAYDLNHQEMSQPLECLVSDKDILIARMRICGFQRLFHRDRFTSQFVSVTAPPLDIETKVNHLTEDKLHLAKALLNSAQKLSTHQEQMEWLAGQCEVWRSKFLASSLMVEELAKWKAALTQKVCDYQDITRKILTEHQITHVATSKTYTNLAILGNNFDLSVMTDAEARIKPKSSTVVDLATGCESLSASLKEQLLGSSPFPINTFVPDLASGEYLTEAEKQAYQVS